jgi:amidase
VLHGLPITLKDSIDTAGVRTTWGTAGRASFVPDEDATVAARLRAAGAILLGKTATPELTMGYETESLVHGRTNNPWDLARTPGGSSGGSAAIRQGGSPSTSAATRRASACPRTAAWRAASQLGAARSRDRSRRSPRSAHDPGAHRASVTISRSPSDPVRADGAPALAPVPRRSARRAWRSAVAFFVDNGLHSPTSEVADAVRQAGSAPRAGGCSRGAAPGIEGDAWGLRAYVADGGATRADPRSGTDDDDARFLRPAGLGAAELPRPRPLTPALAPRAVEDRDVVLAALRTPPPHGHRDALATFSYSMTWNLTGWPAAVVRAGASSGGLPVGVQVVAKPWRDDVALAAAGAIEVALGGDARPPPP